MTATFSIKGKTLKFNTAEDVADMAKEIRETKGLTDIELSGNTFGVEASKAIAEAIRDQKDLTVWPCVWSVEIHEILKCQTAHSLC